MTDISISTGSVRAMLTQMLQGGRPEISILLGDMATMQLSPVDEGDMRIRIGEVLAGLHPDITVACARHLGTMRSCALDVALMRHIGLEPAAVAFIVTTMDALDVTVQDRQIHFSKGPARLHFDLPVGTGTLWTATHDHSLYVGDLPATVASVLTERVAERPVPLAEIASHPELDRHPLMVTRFRILSSGSCILDLDDHEVLREDTLDVLLETSA